MLKYFYLIAACLLWGLAGCAPAPRAPEPSPAPTRAAATVTPRRPTPTRPAAATIPPTASGGYPCRATRQNAAVQAVRDLLAQPELSLTYREPEVSLYSHTHTLAVFEDAQMTRYSVDCTTGQVIEIRRATGFIPTPGKLTQAELAQAALAFITRAAPELASPQRTPVPQAKGGGNVTFQWEGSGVLTDPPGGMKAFIQVTLAEDGSLYHYMNLLPLVGKGESAR